MTTRIQVRRGTAASATSNNEILAAGEIGFETDTKKFKIGDGVTAWNTLQYASGAGTDLDGIPVDLTGIANGDVIGYNGVDIVPVATVPFAAGTPTDRQVIGYNTSTSRYGPITLTSTDTGSQPLDSDLTAIAALATTSFGRAFLVLADAAAARTALALGTAATTAASAYDVAGAAASAQAASQPLDSDLTAIAALATTSFGRSLLTAADAAAVRTTLAAATQGARVTFSDANYVVVATTTTFVAQIGTLSAPRTVTLPAASAFTVGDVLTIFDPSGSVTSTNTLTITRAGSDTIDGATTEVIAAAYGWRRLISDGVSKWSFDGGLLRKSNNLSDVASTATARTNLGLGTAALISSTAGGDLSGTLPSPTVAKINGIAVTGTPNVGDVPKATSASAATWQASSSGSVATDTIFDAKGDLPAGTGADASARVAVGSNGQRLQADSTQTAGIAWADPTPKYGYSSGRFVYPPFTGGAWGAFAFTNASLNYMPIYIASPITADRIVVNATVGGGAGALVRLGIYSPTAAGIPGALLVDGGTAVATGTGNLTVTISQALTPGIYWLAAVVQGAPSPTPTLNYLATSTNAFVPWFGGTGPTFTSGVQSTYVDTASVTGALPGTASLSANYNPIAIGLRIA